MEEMAFSGTRRTRGLIAGLVVIVGLGLVTAGLVITRLFPTGLAISTIPYWLVGALLIWRRSGNRIGWVLLLFAGLWTLTFFGTEYAGYAADKGYPGAVLAAWLGEWTWLPALLTVFVVIPIIFPTGRPLNSRWAAALFSPVRRRAQAFVDQRFNRSTYDARITMEDLSRRLRDEVDVVALGSEMGRVVTQTMQPERLAVWIR
jgi:hypothetical protein